jgi:hypothetical protein
MIASRRGNIESNLESLQKKTLLTSNLRAQIKQKWSKIDYYIENGQVMRIKTHPYKTVSERTEEFYFEQGKLILAFIEDNGEKYTGKSDQRIGKTYYYWEDTVIKEDNPTKEKETSVRNSDSERLLQEAKEYLELMP